MRKISLNINKLGLVVGDKITISLVNSVGKIIPHAINQEITLDNEILEIDLEEQSSFPLITHYKLTLSNTYAFNFTIHSSTETKPHDLYMLLTSGCIEDIFNKYTNCLNESFLKKLELYFTGGYPHFNAVEQNAVYLYNYYADEIKATTSTIDIMKMMDEYLSTLIGE